METEKTIKCPKCGKEIDITLTIIMEDDDVFVESQDIDVCPKCRTELVLVAYVEIEVVDPALL